MNLRQILPLLFALLTIGCVTDEKLASVDFPAPPGEPQVQAQAYFERILKDPYSARFQFGPLVKGWVKDGLIAGGKTHFGWVQIVEINAKNSFGAYVGSKPHYLLFLDDGAVRDITDDVTISHMGGVDVSQVAPKHKAGD